MALKRARRAASQEKAHMLMEMSDFFHADIALALLPALAVQKEFLSLH